MAHLSIVILNYNGQGYLERFLPSVLRSEHPDFSVVVADNASTDDSIRHLQNIGFKEFTNGETPTHGGKYWLRLPQNYGYAEGYNQALRQIPAPYYVLLNSDVEVDAGWLAPLTETLDNHPDIAACQPKIRMHAQPDSFEYAGAAGGFLDKWGYPFCRGRIFDTLETDQGQYDTPSEIFWATGAALCIRGALYHQLGGLDGDYFAHMEEIDLCWRLKRAGYRVWYCPQSVVWHVGGGTLDAENPRKAYLNFRNSLATLLKNRTGWVGWWAVWVRLCLDGAAGLQFLLKGRFAHIWAIVRAHWYFFLHLPSIARKRKQTAKLVETNQLQPRPDSSVGLFPKSIVWQYFIRKKRTYNELMRD